MLVRSGIAAAACTVVVYAALLFFGAFAYDRDPYMCVQGLSLDSGASRGTVYTIMLDRGLGRDRTLYTSLQASEAWQFLAMWDARNQPNDLIRLLSEGKM